MWVLMRREHSPAPSAYFSPSTAHFLIAACHCAAPPARRVFSLTKHSPDFNNFLLLTFTSTRRGCIEERVMSTIPTILLADGNEDDVLFLKQAFSTSSVPNKLEVVTRGDDAIAYLLGEGNYSDRKKHPFPRLLVMDFKLRAKDGFEVLHDLRQVHSLRALPIIILTGSTDPVEINRAYELGANCVLFKPVHFEKLRQLADDLTRYWLSKSPVRAAPPTPRQPVPHHHPP
jgi:CheY-like chemotaxis protein